ncbi:hypothetical protein GQ53DRAFT_831307 [Thozetella sp. PMI_491]|nr:hypothetical protein GQ53DRAFT_831307 [Thozetella sp. PMI_491]
MKTASILAFAAGAAATGFKGTSPFTCPANTDNKCTDTQKGGYDFGDLPLGGFNQYKDFNWFGGWTCGSGSGKRFAPRTNQNYIGATCGHDKSSSPSFGCGSSIDKFSLGGMHVVPEFDCDLEFHYSMPDGSTCKHRNACSSKGTDIVNTQCGGAKNVTIVYPTQTSHTKTTCSVNIHTMTFDCNSASSTTVVKTTTTKATSTKVKTTTTAEVPKTTTTSKPVEKTTTTAKETTPTETTTPVKETSTTRFANTTTTTAAGESSTSTPVVESSSAPVEESSKPPVVESTTSVSLTTSTIFTTSTQTITSCAPTITNCPAESVVTTVVTIAVSTTVCPVTATETPKPTSTGPSTPVETLPCPEVVPKCLNTFLFTVGCSDNTDSTCYCPNEIFIKSVFDCIYAHGETDEIVSESVIFIQGLCAPQMPENPAIATGATITSYVTPTVTITQPAVYTTVTVVATTVVPCTNEAGETIPNSSTTAVVSTTLTVPQVGFTSQGESVGIVPVTTYTAQLTTTLPSPTKAAGGSASGTGKLTPSSTGQVVVTAGGERVKSAGLGFAIAVMAVAAAL